MIVFLFTYRPWSRLWRCIHTGGGLSWGWGQWALWPGRRQIHDSSHSHSHGCKIKRYKFKVYSHRKENYEAKVSLSYMKSAFSLMNKSTAERFPNTWFMIMKNRTPSLHVGKIDISSWHNLKHIQKLQCTYLSEMTVCGLYSLSFSLKKMIPTSRAKNSIVIHWVQVSG